jgi:hypothetical protein
MRDVTAAVVIAESLDLHGLLHEMSPVLIKDFKRILQDIACINSVSL